MKILIGLLVIALLLAHQDNWFWEDNRVVFGFMPIGLFYHACISVAASAVWFLACTIAWPEDLEYIEPVETASGESTDESVEQGEPS